MADVLLFLGWALGLFLVQTSWIGLTPIARTFDTSIILLVYLGLMKRPMVGMPAAVMLGLMTDAYFGGVFGVHLFLYPSVLLAAYVGQKKMNLQFPLYQMAMVGVMDTMYHVMVLATMFVLMDVSVRWDSRLLRDAVLTAAVSPLCFWVLDRSSAKLGALVVRLREEV